MNNKYRKKPVVIEAIQFRSGEHDSAFASDVIAGNVRYTEDGTMLIKTLEGTMEAQTGDWYMLERQKIRYELEQALAAKPEQASHPDTQAVYRCADAMADKMRESRIKGRSGWDNKEQCSAQYLSDLLRSHVEKGDPIDVANFAMMLHQRGERISAAHPVSEPVAHVWRHDLFFNLEKQVTLYRPSVSLAQVPLYLHPAPVSEPVAYQHSELTEIAKMVCEKYKDKPDDHDISIGEVVLDNVFGVDFHAYMRIPLGDLRRYASQPAIPDWAQCQAISDLPQVDECIRALLEDQTADNATELVRAVLEGAAVPTPPTGGNA